MCRLSFSQAIAFVLTFKLSTPHLANFLHYQLTNINFQLPDDKIRFCRSSPVRVGENVSERKWFTM